VATGNILGDPMVVTSARLDGVAVALLLATACTPDEGHTGTGVYSWDFESRSDELCADVASAEASYTAQLEFDGPEDTVWLSYVSVILSEPDRGDLVGLVIEVNCEDARPGADNQLTCTVGGLSRCGDARLLGVELGHLQRAPECDIRLGFEVPPKNEIPCVPFRALAQGSATSPAGSVEITVVPD